MAGIPCKSGWWPAPQRLRVQVLINSLDCAFKTQNPSVCRLVTGGFIGSLGKDGRGMRERLSVASVPMSPPHTHTPDNMSCSIPKPMHLVPYIIIYASTSIHKVVQRCYVKTLDQNSLG
eukprot:5129288-Amphidinium_carterae.1